MIFYTDLNSTNIEFQNYDFTKSIFTAHVIVWCFFGDGIGKYINDRFKLPFL
jgi:hypothetical protein